MHRTNRHIGLRQGGAGAALLVAMAAPWGPADANEIRVSGDCASGVHLVAREARYSDVLKRLAHQLGFQLSLESQSDPLVTFDATLQPADLIPRIAPLENVSMAKTRDPSCANRERIAKVWVLPMGASGNAVRATATPAPEPPRSVEERARQRAGTALVLQAHGVPPPEENADHPQ